MATSRKRNIEIDFIVDDKDAKKSLQSIEGQVSKTGKAFSTAGKLIASGVVADKVVDFARDSIRAYSDLNESLNALDKTYGQAAEGVKKLGEESARSVGLSNAEFNSLAVSVSSFVDTISKGLGQGSVSVLDDLTTRIADFASVMNLDVAEAATLFRSGLAGESEPLRRYGKDLSAATVTAHAYATGIAEAGTKLTEQQKILARYSLLMEQTSDTAGDFADTSDDLANSQRILAAELENSKAAFGENLAPVMNEVISISNDLLTVLNEIGDWMSGEGPGAAGVIGGALKRTFDTLTFGMLPALEAWANSISENEQKQRELAEAQMAALAPSEAQVSIAEAADEKYRILGQTMGELAGSTNDAATAQQTLTEIQLEAVNPAFKLLGSIERRNTAQRKYNEAVAEFGPASSQAASAAGDLIEAELGLDAAAADFNATGGEAKGIIESIGTESGIAKESLDKLTTSLANPQNAGANLFPRATIDRIREAKEALEATGDEIRGLPSQKNVTINVKTIGLDSRIIKESIEESRRR